MNPSAIQRLDKHHGVIRALRMVDLFDADPERAQHFSVDVGPLHCDFSKNKIDDETIRLLVAWAQEQKLPSAIRALFTGKPINNSERRAAAHTVLRQQDATPCRVNGYDVMPDVLATQKKISDFVEQTRCNENYQHIINIGVGGSDLGPRMVTRALSRKANAQRFHSHFLSNADAHVVNDIIASCQPQNTLVIVASKTFTTLETMHNAEQIKQWLEAALGPQQALNQMVAVTAKPEQAEAYGIPKEQIFPFWDWVGGRYSLWSAAGLSLALAVGWASFSKLLAGAAAMDTHFAATPLEKNLPVILGLLGCWYRNWYGYGSHCVVPYDERLKYFVDYLQQLDMESNGKTVGRAGEAVSYKTGPISWGRPGTNSQHAFFQWLHQGRDIAPVDFILAKEPHHQSSDSHRLMASNAIAQAEALLTGKTAPTGQPYRQFDGNRPSNFILLDKLDSYGLGMLIALYEHKTFVQGWLWGINSFDQWGVELGKQLATTIEYELRSGAATMGHDCSTNQLMQKVQTYNNYQENKT